MNLEITEVSKCYKGNVWGLRDFTLRTGPGVLGLVGPNGSGKSTLMRMIATVTSPTAGKIRWQGVDIGQSPNAIRSILGYLPQDFGVYPHLNAVEFLTYLAAARGLHGKTARRRIMQLLELFNLSAAARRPLGSYSGGMKQRVGIAQALLHDPQLVIVDEPTAGLDPEERVRFRNLLAELAGERIVILSSHIVSDIEAAATDIAVVYQGRLISHASPEALLATVEGKVWESLIAGEELAAVKATHLISGTVRTSAGVRVRIISPTTPDRPAKPATPTLEDAYLYLLAQSRNGAGQ